MKDNSIYKFLVEWTKIYIKNKDAVNKSIESIKEAKKKRYKTKKHLYKNKLSY